MKPSLGIDPRDGLADVFERRRVFFHECNEVRRRGMRHLLSSWRQSGRRPLIRVVATSALRRPMRVGLELYDTMVSGVRRPNSVLAEKSFSRFSMRYKIGDDVRLVLGE